MPHNRGFDQYLGIPFSGFGCREGLSNEDRGRAQHAAHGYLLEDDLRSTGDKDPGAAWTPLVHQANGKTTVPEQPVDFAFPSGKYNAQHVRDGVCPRPQSCPLLPLYAHCSPLLTTAHGSCSFLPFISLLSFDL